jgi:hypothetical protein
MEDKMITETEMFEQCTVFINEKRSEVNDVISEGEQHSFILLSFTEYNEEIKLGITQIDPSVPKNLSKKEVFQLGVCQQTTTFLVSKLEDFCGKAIEHHILIDTIMKETGLSQIQLIELLLESTNAAELIEKIKDAKNNLHKL